MSTKVIMSIGAIAVVAAACVGSLILFQSDSAPAEEEAAAGHGGESAPADQPAYVSMESFVVSIGSDKQRGMRRAGTYLQVSFNLESDNKEAVERYEQLKPAVRGKVLDVLLEVPEAVLDKKSARESMKRDVLNTVNQALVPDDGHGDAPTFSAIYVTRFVTQAG